MPALIPYDERYLAMLAPLQPEGPDPETLRRDLTDFARGHGAQVVIAMADGQPCGAAGWVSFGVETEGIVYGVPVLAGTEAAARALLGHLIERARGLGARQLRVSRFPGEEAKSRALTGLGFVPLLDMISLERSSAAMPDAVMPGHLRRVPLPEVDWERFARAFNTAFAEVPNAPPVDARIARLEWEGMDPEASHVWQDEAGCYLAWIGTHADGYVDEIGVDESLRGRGVAVALYRITAEALLKRGVGRMYTLLASTNQATLRLHEKLGFREFTRRTVFALDLNERDRMGKMGS